MAKKTEQKKPMSLKQVYGIVDRKLPGWLVAFRLNQPFKKGEIEVFIQDHLAHLKSGNILLARVRPRRPGETESVIQIMMPSKESALVEEHFRSLGVKVDVTPTLKYAQRGVAVRGRTRDLVRTTSRRLCRSNMSGDEGNHYWNATTGKRVRAPRAMCYTPEQTCPSCLREHQSASIVADTAIDEAEYRMDDR
jgi:hypothetical protein